KVSEKKYKFTTCSTVRFKSLHALACFLKQYRKSGFTTALITGKELAENIEVEATLEEKREGQDNPITNPDKNFKKENFNVILDTAIISIQSRFQQFKISEENFGLLHNIASFKGWENGHLMDQRKVLHDLLQDPDSMSSESDIDAIELCEELQMLSSLVPENYTAQEALQFIHSNNLNGVYPNTSIALRILLTIPVTAASGERSFFLKLIKTHLRSSMLQERLGGLAQLSIESDIAGQLDYSDILQDFSSVKARKKTIYGN
uniref:HAT C-terminal dimerisation domain-containing protein n=1 Tax=Latimeria chalumnae TaxID=7897 RepID=H2ZU64_LATCH